MPNAGIQQAKAGISGRGAIADLKTRAKEALEEYLISVQQKKKPKQISKRHQRVLRIIGLTDEGRQGEPEALTGEEDLDAASNASAHESIIRASPSIDSILEMSRMEAPASQQHVVTAEVYNPPTSGVAIREAEIYHEEMMMCQDKMNKLVYEMANISLLHAEPTA